jgi:uncharacterized protein with FMN-binding domain
MSAVKKGVYIALATTFIVSLAVNVARPQGALTLVKIVAGGTVVSSSNPLPVTCISGGC